MQAPADTLIGEAALPESPRHLLKLMNSEDPMVADAAAEQMERYLRSATALRLTASLRSSKVTRLHLEALRWVERRRLDLVTKG